MSADHRAGIGAALYREPVQILLAGLALGVAGDYLLWGGGLAGPGLVVWLALLTGTALWLAHEGGSARRNIMLVWSATALGAALILVWRDLEGLVPAMWLVMLTCIILTLLDISGITLRAARLGDQLRTLFMLPPHLATLAPRLCAQVDLNRYTQSQRLSGILRGLVFALPVLVVFFALFAAADAAFSRYALAVTGVFSPATPRHVLMVLVFGWIAAGLLALVCSKNPAAPRTAFKPLPLGVVEANVILVLVTVLFGLFVLLQLGYLFGGSATIERTSGLTLAEYARRGFFELLIVAGLTLALLLSLGATNCDRRMFSRFGTVLVIFVLIILISAAQRLVLYTDAFGLTIDRFNALAVMLWQALNLVSFAATVLRGRIEGFASGLAISGIVSLMLLGAVNPAAMVAKINIERAAESQRTLDVEYLLSLGSDAVPAVLEHLAALPAQDQCTVARHVLLLYPTDDTWSKNGDWRTWNGGLAAARKAVIARSSQLRTLSC